MSSHFEQKDALAHVLSKKASGTIAAHEAHGSELPGHLAAAFSASKETALVLLLFWTLLGALEVGAIPSMVSFFALGTGWLAWKVGRSGWLGWARLERLHRLIEQEKYEIEHHRPQEREELVALYQAKGFEGKLLDDVVDTLMADQDRLLKVMLEEEMGLTLQTYEHPIQHCFGSAVGSAIALGVSGFFFYFLPTYGMLIASGLILMASSGVSAYFKKNRLIPAIVWNLSIGALAFGVTYFLFHAFL